MDDGVFLGQLHAFLEIARLGNFTRAAEALYLTQPALSSRLKRLEQEIGAPLLTRDNKGVRLTDAGTAFLPFAERIVATVADGRGAVVNAISGISGDLTIAATQSVTTYILPAVINAYVATYPRVRLSVKSCPSEEVIEMVAKGEARLGLARSLHHTAVASSPLYDEEFVLAVGQRHPLFGAEAVSVDLLRKETLITLFRSDIYRNFVHELFSGGPLPPVIDLDNPESAKRMVGDTFGVILVPRTAISPELARGSFFELTVEDAPEMSRTMAALVPRDQAEYSSVTEFLYMLRTHLEELGFGR